MPGYSGKKSALFWIATGKPNALTSHVFRENFSYGFRRAMTWVPIPNAVRKLREAAKLEQRELAKKSGITERAIRLDDALAEVFISRDAFAEMIELLRYKKNLVLAGPPGVGKTLISSSLAFALMGERDEARLERVQFHQSYSYEDFVRGYRPKESGGFEFRDGPLLSICERARSDGFRPYVLVIDEINRGNLSKILGDLMLLIEGDKRSDKWSARLTYSKPGEPAFFVPPNLHIIGTMNTADRSLAMVDYALRRRFAFVDIKPAFDAPAFRAHLAELGVSRKLQNKIISRMGKLNLGIAQDRRNLGEGYCIGHSYFCQGPADGKCDESWFERIIKFEIGQLLREYWSDDESKVSDALSQLLAAGN
jgi:5-methylcytosine-specific restriction enzyme B